MRHYSKIINSTKKQFIDIDELGEDSKFATIGQGLNGLALGRLLLGFGEIDDEQALRYGNPHKDEFYVGAWTGDAISIVGDYDTRSAKEKVTEIPYKRMRSLYDLTKEKEYRNVTLDVIKWLAREETGAGILAALAKDSNALMKKLTDLVATGQFPILKDKLKK